jgi:phosphoglycerate dehydrogenase-like enzyme
MTRIAVTSRSFSRHPVLRAELMKRFPLVTFNETGESLVGAKLIGFLKGHDAAITALEALGDEVFAAVPEIKVVSKYGVGLDMIDLPAMARRGVRLGWRGGVNRRAVSELVIAFALTLLRRLPEANASVQGGRWQQLAGQQLSGRTVGIVGCGHIGKDLAVLLRAFDCRVLAHDVRTFPEFYARHGVAAAGLDELLEHSDIVTVHLPLDRSTANILDRDRLSRLKPTAILINAARGGLVDETAVKDMLKGARLAGAAFDVFAGEPPTDLELLRLPNVIGTPHIGGSTEEAILAMGRAAIDGLTGAQVPTAELWTPAAL